MTNHGWFRSNRANIVFGFCQVVLLAWEFFRLGSMTFLITVGIIILFPEMDPWAEFVALASMFLASILSLGFSFMGGIIEERSYRQKLKELEDNKHG